MDDQEERIRETLQRAADSADGNIQEQFRSIDEGFMEVVEGDKTQEGPSYEDRLVELEEKLDGLRSETEGETLRHIRNATQLIDEYRSTVQASE